MVDSFWLGYTLPLYVETVAAVVVLSVGLVGRRTGRWAAFAIAAGMLWLVPQAVYVATNLEMHLVDGVSLVFWLDEHHLLTVLHWLRMGGVVLLVAALVLRGSTQRGVNAVSAD